MPKDGWNGVPEYADDEGGEMVIDRQKEEQEQETKPPKMYQVVMLNDDYSEFGFVEHVLQKFFDKSEAQSQKLAMEIHTVGKCICGIYSREIAETKSAIVNEYSRGNDFPLRTIFQEAP